MLQWFYVVSRKEEKMLQWFYVISSRISRVAYDDLTQTLHVQFKRGRIYKYSPVSRETFMALYNAPSVGAYFGEHVHDNPDINCTEEALSD